MGKERDWKKGGANHIYFHRNTILIPIWVAIDKAEESCQLSELIHGWFE